LQPATKKTPWDPAVERIWAFLHTKKIVAEISFFGSCQNIFYLPQR
jgi:hypothetical protein